MNTLTPLIFGLFFCLCSGTSNATPVSQRPDELRNVLDMQHPDIKVLMRQDCRLGVNKIEAVGLVAEERRGRDNVPLHAYIALKPEAEWKLWEVPRRQSYRAGSIRNFLDAFWQDKFVGDFEISCTTLDKDEKIRKTASGAFIKPFTAKTGGSVDHLCFTASDTYNDWVCASLAGHETVPRVSFLQMNAD